MQANLPSILYPRLFKVVLDYLTERFNLLNEKGQVLPSEYWSRAVKLGINKPYLVRVIYSDEVFSPPKKLIPFLAKLDIEPKRIAGMAIGQGIVINPELADVNMVIEHELRHVAQYLAVGSLKLYLEFYLMELIYFGYGKGPQENDALLSSNL